MYLSSMGESSENFTDDEKIGLRLTMEILAWCSFGLSLPVVITYLVFKRRFPSSMALYFSVASLIFSVALLFSSFFGEEELFASRPLCILQGFSIQLSGTILTWWFFFIALDLYFVVILKKGPKEMESVARWFHIIGFGFPIIQSVLPFFIKGGLYGQNGFWCWIKNVDYGMYEFLLFYGAMGVTTFAAIIIWVRVASRIYTAYKVCKVQYANTYLIRHVFMVVIYTLIFSVMLTRRLYLAITGVDMFILALLHTIALSIIGLVDFLVFGVSVSNFRLWRDFAISCSRQQEYETLND